MKPAAYVDEILAWRREKDKALRRRDGWLALAGLHWLAEGSQTAGSSDGADLRLPASVPPRLGSFEVRHGQVFFRRDRSLPTPLEGERSDGAALRPDDSEDPDFLRAGEVTLVVIQRAGRLGLRVWDNARRERTSFRGRSWFDVDRAWSVQARFEVAPGGRRVVVPNQLGDLTEEPLLGSATFSLAGRAARLQAVPTGDGKLWFLFEDATNGETTYPAGRFLVAEPAEAGLTLLDFNRAYNPPCAFTPYATCPLPPKANRLRMRVEAGERYRADEARPHATRSRQARIGP